MPSIARCCHWWKVIQFMPNCRQTSAGLHFSVQTASTAWALSIAGSGGLGLRLRLVFGVEVVAEFLGGLFIGQFEFEFAFLRARLCENSPRASRMKKSTLTLAFWRAFIFGESDLNHFFPFQNE